MDNKMAEAKKRLDCHTAEECIEKIQEMTQKALYDTEKVQIIEWIASGVDPSALALIAEFGLVKNDYRLPWAYYKAMVGNWLRRTNACLTFECAWEIVVDILEKEKGQRQKPTEDEVANLASKEIHIRLEAGEDPLMMYINYNNEFVHLREQKKSYTERFVFLKYITRMLAEHIAHLAVRKIGYALDDKGRYVKD